MGNEYNPDSYRANSYAVHTDTFASGASSPRDYLEKCLDVIDAREPTVKAWVVMNVEAARDAADASSRRWKEGRQLSAIDGMPLGIKDLLATKDMPTQMGCAAFEGAFPKDDNAAVWALREAGAVILGKTVTTELGGAQPGPTTNPFDSGRTPGGSSSGSAAAVGAGMVPAAIGTQVGGSIIRPASFCGNFALKPSQGAINRGERQSTSMSTHGPHAGTLHDMWQVAIEIARRAGGDPGFSPLTGPLVLPEARRPLSLAVMETELWGDLPGPALVAFEAVLAQLETSGVHILRRGDLFQLERFEQQLHGITKLNIDITAWENHFALRNTLSKHPDGVSERGKGAMTTATVLGVDGYRELLQRRAALRQEFEALGHYVDAVIAPSSVGSANEWAPDMKFGPGVIPTGNPIFNTPSSTLGAPSLTMPLTSVGRLPMGIQLMGQHGSDQHLTAMAHWICDTVSFVAK